MHVTVVQIQVKSDHIHDFIEATRLNHEGSVRESGNRRFDLCQSTEDATKFILYEVYADADAAAAHKKTSHYLKWRDAVNVWMAVPRLGIPYKGIFPKPT